MKLYLVYCQCVQKFSIIFCMTNIDNTDEFIKLKNHKNEIGSIVLLMTQLFNPTTQFICVIFSGLLTLTIKRFEGVQEGGGG